jgi:hypothetical protein
VAATAAVTATGEHREDEVGGTSKGAGRQEGGSAGREDEVQGRREERRGKGGRRERERRMGGPGGVWSGRRAVRGGARSGEARGPGRRAVWGGARSGEACPV